MKWIRSIWNVLLRQIRIVLAGPGLGFFDWGKALIFGLSIGLFFFALPSVLVLLAGKAYQHADQHELRGAPSSFQGHFEDDHNEIKYLDQGWDRSDSLWFYNVSQGSNILPWDFFLELEDIESTKAAPLLFRRNENLDRFRYLTQEASVFNPEGLPVGFVRDGYRGKDYMGFNCSTCHTSQINHNGVGIRIDGGPAMADMDGFMRALEKALTLTLVEPERQARFIEAVLARNGFARRIKGGRSYGSAEEIKKDLADWTARTRFYNQINHSDTEYGYARLDAFGRIYNRVLQHVINRPQAQEQLLKVLKPNGAGASLLNNAQAEAALDGLSDVVLGREGFATMMSRLEAFGINEDERAAVLGEFFNPANAPVSYPYLWDIAQTDYVQWNGLAGNAGVGALGRNAGQVIGVFASLDWKEEDHWWARITPATFISGQSAKKKSVKFESSVNDINLARMESQLKSLQSPLWDEALLGELDLERVKRGKVLFSQYCASCHAQVDRSDWDRKITSIIMGLDSIGTDPRMANNASGYTGRSGNFAQTYQSTDVGSVIITDPAPARQILSAVTAGVIGTPDNDKWWIRRVADRVYMIAASLFNNDLEASVKSGDYKPDTTADPYASLKSYKARPLNGIWATAPYLHNGSVPTLLDLMRPAPGSVDHCGDGEFRPVTFSVGSREFDAEKVGFKSQGISGPGTLFDTRLPGNSNAGHEYAAGITPGLRETDALPALCGDQRKDLLEYLKSL